LKGRYNIIGKKEMTNSDAKANVSIEEDGFELAELNAPTILALEKEIAELKNMVLVLPTLSSDLIWVKDDNKKNTYSSAPVTVAKTTKKDVVITLAEATDRHPAQAKLVAEDVIEGKYVTTKKSSAITS